MSKISDTEIDEILSRKSKDLKKEDWDSISSALDELRHRRTYAKIAMMAYEATGKGVLFNKPCSVTAFDMRVKALADGRDRGVWIELTDKQRTGFRLNHFKEAINSWLDEINITGMQRFSAMSWADTLFKDLAGTEVRESALLEWPNLKRFHRAIDEQIDKVGKAEKT